MRQTFNRKELYDLVWATPRTKILEKFAISNSGFQKILKDFNIPYPKSGYWMKRKYKKHVIIEKLSTHFNKKNKIELLIREKDNPINYDLSPLTILTKEIENDSNSTLIVSKKLSNPNILTKNTMEYFSFQKINYPNAYRNFEKLTLPIRVEDLNEKRALRLMDALVKLLNYRGHSITGNINRYARVNIKGIEIYFDLREKNKRIPGKDKWSTSEYIPTGKFAFKMGEYSREKEITDGKRLLELRLAEIVAFFELYAEKELEWEEQLRIDQIKSKKEEKRKKEFEEKRNNEISNFNNLVRNTNLYHKAQNIRVYINTVEKNAIEKNVLTKELKEWLIWARDKTDWLDPLINKCDELLNDVEK